MRSRIAAFVLSVLLLCLAGATPLRADTGATGGTAETTGSTGPALTADPVALETALSCPDGYHHPDRPVVLLVHGTATTATESWPFGFGKVLPAAGFDWCMVQLPDRALGDIQVAAEYVVAAVRRIGADTGRRVSVVGHSQGALEPRWAMRFWPDVAAAVEDFVSLAGSNQGVWSADGACTFGSCAPAVWQQRTTSAFIAALNQSVPAEVSHTAIYSLTDELVVPAENSRIAGAANVLIQDVCPGRPVHHLQFLFDAAVVAVVLDALRHPGPADVSRVDRQAVCMRDVARGIDRVQAYMADATLYGNAFAAFAGYERTQAEPPLRDYAR